MDKHRLTGSFGRTAGSDRLLYEIFYAVPDIMFEVSGILTERFGCSGLVDLIDGIDEFIAKCRCGEIVLEIGWDNWSGFYIFSDREEGDALVQSIGDHLDSIIGGKEFEKYIQHW